MAEQRSGSDPVGEEIHQFGATLRKFRDAAKLSRPQVAEAVHRDATTIRNWEKGDTFPNLPDLLALQRLFQLASIELLLGGTYEFPSRQMLTTRREEASA